MIGKNDKVQKVKNVTCVYKVTSQSLVVLPVRHHCTGYFAQKSPQRSRDRDYVALKSDRNIIHRCLRYIWRQTL